MSNALSLFKVLSDDTRLKILNALNEKDSYVELLSQRLQLSSPTVSFHLKKLMDVGLVEAHREQYYVVYSLRKEAFTVSLSSLVFQSDDSEQVQRSREEAYRRKILKTFMPDGYCEVMPAQLKKRLIIYEEIFSHFQPGKTYTEQEVNMIILPMHEDFCTVRRSFIALGWMTRDKGIYTVNPNPVTDENTYKLL